MDVDKSKSVLKRVFFAVSHDFDEMRDPKPLPNSPDEISIVHLKLTSTGPDGIDPVPLGMA